MKRVLFILVACLVGISSLMAQSFSLPGYLFGRCPDYSITYDKNDAQEQKDVYICDGNKSVVRIDSYKWNSSSSDWVYDGKTVMENDNQGRTLVAISYSQPTWQARKQNTLIPEMAMRSSPSLPPALREAHGKPRRKWI